MPSNTQYKTKHGTADLINSLISEIVTERNAKNPIQINYLEIGVWQGYNLERIQASSKTGVDPKPRCWAMFQPNTTIYKSSSDDFFRDSKGTYQYSIIFIDGFHDAIQVHRDLINALRVLTIDGLIVIDDVFPENHLASKRWVDLSQEEKSEVNKHAFTWRGDVYKVILYLKHEPFVSSNVTLDLIINGDERKAIIKPKINPVDLAYYLNNTRSLFLEYEKSIRNAQLWRSEDFSNYM